MFTAKLDGCHTLEIGTDLPRSPHDPNSVGLQVIRTPISPRRVYGPVPMQYPQSVRPLLTAQQLRAVIFYGPHECDVCGCMIVKANREAGDVEFDYPDGPIYPNTDWKAHVHRDPPEPVPFVLIGANLKPSAARAIANMLLSAATEARG